MPLLFWASEVTGNAKYADHAQGAYHNRDALHCAPGLFDLPHVFFNPETGEPVKGVTHQGHRHGSAWTEEVRRREFMDLRWHTAISRIRHIWRFSRK